jgi:uncharacterized protein with PQ loop repeat
MPDTVNAEGECVWSPSIMEPYKPIIEDDWIVSMAVVAILLSIIRQIPQVVKIAKRKQACDISIPTLWITMVSLIIWIVWFALSGRVWSLVSVISQAIIMAFFLAYTYKYSQSKETKPLCAELSKMRVDVERTARQRMRDRQARDTEQEVNRMAASLMQKRLQGVSDAQ